MAITNDGKVLAVAASYGVALLDVGRVVDGVGDPLVGFVGVGGAAGVIYVAVTAADDLLFTANESAGTITVIDLPRARSGFSDAVIGTIGVGMLPVGLAISPDQRWLFSTNQVADDSLGWPSVCPYMGLPDQRPEGAVVVIDIGTARVAPENAVVSVAPAGCTPVRAAVDPLGDTLWVTARGSNAALAFNAAKLLTDPYHALIGSVPVGPAPVGIAVFGQGRRVVVANSNRFAPSPPETLTVIDAMRPTAGGEAVMATLPAGAFPREVAVAPDRRTLFVTNYSSSQVEVVDLLPFFGQGFNAPGR
jgi:DNA-binding beta-propeller fold protein YncE